MIHDADWVSLTKVSLSFPCVLGISEWERRETQTLELELAMSLDLDGAAGGDLRRSVDYAAALDHVQFIAQHGRWMLLESMAAAMARLVLAPPAIGEKRAQVRTVLVRLKKPDVFGGRAVPSVEIRRDEDWYESRELTGPSVGAARIEILQEAAKTGAYRIHLPPATTWRVPSTMTLQVIAGRVISGGTEVRPRSTIVPSDVSAPSNDASKAEQVTIAKELSTPDEVSACLLGVSQPPLTR
jgi:FolB domain-containing protein